MIFSSISFPQVCGRAPAPTPVYSQSQNLPPDCLDVCARMMIKHPPDRPSAGEILRHPWFQRMSDLSEDATTKISPGICQVLQNYHAQSEVKKAVYFFVAYFASFPALVEAIRPLFSHFDRNNTGTVEQDDIKFTLQKAGMSRAISGGIASSMCRRKLIADVGERGGTTAFDGAPPGLGFGLRIRS